MGRIGSIRVANESRVCSGRTQLFLPKFLLQTFGCLIFCSLRHEDQLCCETSFRLNKPETEIKPFTAEHSHIILSCRYYRGLAQFRKFRLDLIQDSQAIFSRTT
jgi:hypothetical protein